MILKEKLIKEKLIKERLIKKRLIKKADLNQKILMRGEIFRWVKQMH